MAFFYNICRKGDINEINKYIEKYPNVYWADGLSGACVGGHTAILELLISMRRPDLGISNWNILLHYASYSGHIEIVKLMISLGANNLDYAIYQACKNDDKEIILFLIEKGANIDECNNTLNFEDIYYLYLKGISRVRFGQYTTLYDKCVIVHSYFYDIISQILSIEDLAKIVVSF